MKKYDVTIGIPIYNSVDCIQRTLLSAFSQSYPSIEFLLVDDCCNDGTFDVVNNVLFNNKRSCDVHIITHPVNLGVSASRNEIINEALGDYLYFMDSDDVISENAIELLISNIHKYDAEIVFGSYEKIEISGKKIIYQYPKLYIQKEDELASFAYRKYAGIQASACNILIKTSILRNKHLCFINTNYWEDMVFTFDLVTLFTRAVLLPDITYSYICRENSLSHYQQREVISKEEIMRNVYAIDYLKKTSYLFYHKVYFPNRCLNIVMTDFYIACNILKRRKYIFPSISDLEIKMLMQHPATLNQICSFRESRFENIILCVIAKLPSRICVLLILCIGKIKKLI